MNTDLLAGLMWLAFAAAVLLYFVGTPLVLRFLRRRSQGGEDQ